MKSENLRNRILAFDLAWIPVALAAEQALCPAWHCGQVPLAPFNFIVYLVCTLFAWVLLSENLHLDGFCAGWRLSSVVSHLLLAVALLMVILLAVDNVSGRYVGRLTLSVFSLFLLAGFLCIRGIALRLVLRQYRNGHVNRVVILGSDRLATELAMKFNHHPEFLCKVIGFLCPKSEFAAPCRDAEKLPLSVSTMEVADLLRQHQVNELVLAHTPASHEILRLVAFCRERAIRISLVPEPYELYLSRPKLLDLGGLPLLQLGDMSIPTSARIGKRILDLALGFVLALVVLPVVLVFGAALRFHTGRALRWERRVGLQGSEFSMLRLNVERDVQPRSRFEWLLWQLSISELPQLWNVLRGDMSLVGPRPESPERASRYSVWQLQRLTVRPGMTGRAQVYGLREQHSSEDKTRHDLQYMLRPSLLKDLSLIIETVWTLAFRFIKIPKHALTANFAPGIDATPHPVSYFSPTQPFPEMLQHAHRTQSGSD
ncbi:MAG: sugar transferase [Candidatus Sulfotelmatobacter sp.]